MKKSEKVDRSGMIGCLKGYLSEEVVDLLNDKKLDKEIEIDFLNAIEEPLLNQDKETTS